ncbi:Rad21/Rec8 N terminal domain-containing protein [Metarhizium album ARSEF 1941]|uniref:Rad21/Rec8 N terminal domain-containing protein n=1 Tax=Metarhizium album (strain ARSEF 1941) TaxID=1081103 RepID=A0A0B2X381_METAS|nr:Rad21/Rec8 N terminal domain-containing protein [Metarhizium album ARSEF 1941]KHO00208.1 Rad21/Rec8 N terminal domain-containing protein [Metarhizium album ARSEF 1941]
MPAKRVQLSVTNQRRQHITLQDDPSFDPMAMLPGLDKLLNPETLFNLTSTQESAAKYSQMSPLVNGSAASAATSRRSSFIGLDLPPSSHSVGSYQLPFELGRHCSPFNKGIPESENIPKMTPFIENDFDPICGVGLDFDADGNLIGMLDDEPELPPLRGTSPDPLHEAGVTMPGIQNIVHQDDSNLVEEPILDFGEAALPDAELFAAPPAVEERNTDAPTLTTETTGSNRVVAPCRSSHRRKFQEMLDQDPRVPRGEFRSWTENYATNMLAARNRIKATTQAKAKQNALEILYLKGLGHVGNFQKVFGVDHPLALDFAGTTLKAHLLGLSVDDIEDVNPKKGRRRKSPEAFVHDDDDRNNTRNVRRRIEDELARGETPAFTDGLDLAHDTAPELGLEAGAALEDRHSSSLMPWSRQGSAAPGSASRTAPGSAQKFATAPSPLHGRASLVGSIDRRSDPIEGSLGELAVFDSQLSSIERESGLLPLDFDAANDTLPSTQGLDTSSQRFLAYVANQILGDGVPRARGAQEKHWIDFDILANPDIHTKAIAAQAFVHVLSLATKNIIAVEQDGIEDKVPFGALRVGLTDLVLNAAAVIAE